MLSPDVGRCVLGTFFCEGRLIATSREGSNGPMHLNMKNKIFPLTSNIIHPKVLTLRYPVQPEMLAVIH